MKTLGAVLAPDGKALQQMTVEMDGGVSVVRMIIPRLMVAAQMERMRVFGEDDAISPHHEGKLREGEHGDGGSGSESETKVETDGASGGASSSISGSHSDQGDEPEQSDEDSKDRTNGETKPSRMRILELKAEGMAEFLAEEYPSKLPNDFF